jgi:hypothetical protein
MFYCFWCVGGLVAAYMAVLLWYFPVINPAIRVDHSITGVEKTFDFFSPLPYEASIKFQVDGEIFDENFVKANKDKLPACTMRLEITPLFASDMKLITKEFDCFKRDRTESYIGVVFAPRDIPMPVGFLKVKYSVEIEDVRKYDVHLTVSHFKSHGVWGLIYSLQLGLKSYIYYLLYFVVAVIHIFV